MRQHMSRHLYFRSTWNICPGFCICRNIVSFHFLKNIECFFRRYFMYIYDKRLLGTKIKMKNDIFPWIYKASYFFLFLWLEWILFIGFNDKSREFGECWSVRREIVAITSKKISLIQNIGMIQCWPSPAGWNLNTSIRILISILQRRRKKCRVIKLHEHWY